MAEQRVQARWGIQNLDLGDEDPWEAAVEGKPIDVSGDEGTLSARLAELAAREARLWEQGVRCALKERADSCCHACPVTQLNNPESAISLLCKIGREQERVAMRLAVVLHGEPHAE
jgi:hypothetical protein